MMRSVKTCSLLALTAFALAAVPVGCSSADEERPVSLAPATSGNVVLGLSLEGSALRVEALYAADEEVEIREAHGDEPTLRWELRRDSGVVASGVIPDPRIGHTNDLRSGKLRHEELRFSRAALDLVAPNSGGELVLVDATGEIARGTVPVLRGAGGTLSKQSTGGGSLRPLAAGDGAGTEWEKLINNGRCGGHLNVAILPEGFTEAEMPKFREVASRIANGLRNTDGWSDHFSLVNVWTKDLASKQSGPGKKGKPNDTVFRLEYEPDVNGSRHMVDDAARTAARFAEARSTVKATTLLVIANTTDAGLGYSSGSAIFMSMSNDAIPTLAHELGHNVLNLHDEYASSDYPDYCKFSRTVAGTSFNLNDKNVNKWSAFFPGPLVEGGGGCAKGIWKTAAKCTMDDQHDAFCPACTKRMNDFFAARAERAKTNPPAICKQLPDAGAPAVKDCNNGGAACDASQVCAFNGDGYCCKAPWAGTPGEECKTAGDCSRLHPDDPPGAFVCSRAELAGPDGGTPRAFCAKPDVPACGAAATTPSKSDCSNDKTQACGSGEICSASGAESSCCRTERTALESCDSDADCKADKLCARISETGGDNGIFFACLSPGEGCLAPKVAPKP